jgi:Adenylate and Guanylate cyclase catalytic domain
MESTGVASRIHVSQATADALIAGGKENWLTPRKDKIVAKGKGEMTTFFVELESASTARSTTDQTSSETDSFESPDASCPRRSSGSGLDTWADDNCSENVEN